MACILIRDSLMCLVIVWWMLIQYIDSYCDQGWLSDYRVKACFKLYDNPKLDWKGANNFCHAQNAYLSDLADFTEQKFVNDTVLGERYIRHGAWLGGSDIDRGVWKWVNESRMHIDLFLWQKGNPDNGQVFFELGDLGEDCLEITTEPGHRGKLNDYRCREKIAFVCKSTKMFQMTTTITTTTTNSTTEIHIKQKEKEKPTSQTIVVVISLACSLVVASLVIAIVLIYRRRHGSPQVYADTVHISTNEHFYTGLETTRHDSNGNSYTFEQPRSFTGKTGSMHELLQSQCSEPNVYESLEDSLNSTGSIRYQATEVDNGCIAMNSSSKNRMKPKFQNRLGQSKNELTRKSDKSCSGYLDMDTGHYVELSDKRCEQRDTAYVEPRIYMNPESLSHSMDKSGKSFESASVNDGYLDEYVNPKAMPGKFDSRKSDNEQTSAYYLTPVHEKK